MGKGQVEEKKRGSRSKKLQLSIPLPAVVARMKLRKPRKKRVSDRAYVVTAAHLEYLCRMLMEDACALVDTTKEKTLNVKHIARALNDTSTKHYGIFNTRVACINTSQETNANEDDHDNAEQEEIVE